MKSSLFQLLIGCCALGAMAGAARADSFKITANIPFEFHVGTRTLPAGEYVIEREQMSDVEYLRSADTGAKVAAILGSPAVESSGRARLVFRDYGDSKYLAYIWTQNGFGTNLPASKEERALGERAQLSDVPMSTAGTR
jgi:hypothetical protein